MQESDTAGAGRIVLDRGHFSRNIYLVALEIDQTIKPLVAAALVADRDHTVVAPAGGARIPRCQAFFGLRLGDFREIVSRLLTETGAARTESLNTHLYAPS